MDSWLNNMQELFCENNITLHFIQTQLAKRFFSITNLKNELVKLK